jgi:ribosomal protein L18
VTQAVDPVQEIEIKLKKIETNEIDAYYAELERKTRTQTEIVLQAYSVDKFSLQQLLDAKIISQELYTERLRALQNKLLADISKGPPKIEEQTKKINEYQLEAARNSQDIIAQTFEDLTTGAEVSAQSILKSFGQMLLKLAAQAAAANVAGLLFGEASGNTGAKGSGLVGAALGAFGFAASRDSGGRGRKGVPYRIGTGAQPEWFVPDTSGSFVPAGMGGASVTNNFIIQGDQPVAQRTQMQIAAAASRGVSRANRRNN